MAKIAINGFGRIGRLFLRQAIAKNNNDIVAINDLGSAENLAYLLKYDTVYGRFAPTVSAHDNHLEVADKKIAFLQVKELKDLPWRKLGIDIVVEATGVFEKYEEAKGHLEAGAKRVVITAPAKDPDGAEGRTVLMGVNEDDLKAYILTSNGSCTTNAASPIIQILSENPGIEKAILNTVHGYTATQNIVDGPAKGKDFRRGRAAAQNITPSTTGAALAVVRALPEFKDKFDGIAMRVPVSAGSVADITFISKRKTTSEEINEILSKAAKTPRWEGIMKTVSDQIVSSDILGEPYGAIIDLNFTKVVGGNLVKVLSWYDNEWGYVSTLVKHIQAIAHLI